MIDRDQFSQSLRHWYPIIAAIASSLLNFVAFMVAIGFSSQSLIWTAILALIGTMGLSVIVVYLSYKLTVSGRVEEFLVVDAKDECEILSEGGTKAIYRRIVSFQVNRTTPVYVAFLANFDGQQLDFRAYQVENPSTKYDISMQRSGGRRVLFINLGRILNRGEQVNGLCIEWVATDSFMNEHEGVSVSTDPGQKHCAIQVTLPKGCNPVTGSSEWYVYYERNPIPLHHGYINATNTSDGNYLISHDFSHLLSRLVVLHCSVSWRWTPRSITGAAKPVL